MKNCHSTCFLYRSKKCHSEVGIFSFFEKTSKSTLFTRGKINKKTKISLEISNVIRKEIFWNIVAPTEWEKWWWWRNGKEKQMEMFFKKFLRRTTNVRWKRTGETKAKIYLTCSQTPSRYWLIDILNLAQLKFLLRVTSDDTHNRDVAPRSMAGEPKRKQINIRKQYRKTFVFDKFLFCWWLRTLSFLQLQQDERYLPSYNLFVNNFGDIWWFLGKEKVFRCCCVFYTLPCSSENIFLYFMFSFFVIFLDIQSSRYIVFLLPYGWGDIKSISLIYLD